MISFRTLLGLSPGKLKEGEPLPESQAVMDREAVSAVARQYAEQHAIAWIDPVRITFHHGVQGNYWRVKTNATGRGAQSVIQIEDESGKVLGEHSLPR